MTGIPVAGVLSGVRGRRSSHRVRGRAVEALLVARVVGEAHLHLEGFALVVGRRRVGGSRRALNVSVGDAGRVRRQRLAHLRRAADGGQTRGRRVDRRRDSVAHPRRELAT